jgi:hypothetical protein
MRLAALGFGKHWAKFDAQQWQKENQMAAGFRLSPVLARFWLKDRGRAASPIADAPRTDPDVRN